MKETPGKIFLADQRGMIQTTQFRRISTFNFGEYAQEHKGAFGNLYVVNDEMLAGGQSASFSVEHASYIILLPVTGEINLLAHSGSEIAIDVEEVLLLTLPAGSTFKVFNPYEDEVISYLQIWIRTEQSIVTPTVQRFSFDFESLGNNLLPIISDSQQEQLSFSFNLGLFNGRQEAFYALKPASSLFAFVISGAFELEGRLLQERDGLALWNTQEVELEALSNHALIMLLELKG